MHWADVAAQLSAQAKTLPHTQERPSCVYKDFSDRFRLEKFNFALQYSHIYFCRLLILREFLVKKAEKTCTKILGIKDSSVQNECVIIGVVFKDMKLKPTILTNYLEQLNVNGRGTESYLSDTDVVYLEDQNARCVVEGPAVNPAKLISGQVVAAVGVRGVNGRFQARDLLFPGMPIPPAMPEGASSDDVFVAFIAAPNASGPATAEATQVFRDVLLGIAGGEAAAKSSRVVRLVIIGDVMPLHGASSHDDALSGNTSAAPMEALIATDKWIESLAVSVPTDIVPGANDPTNYALPQQPLLPALLPKSSKLQSCRSVPNPYHFSIDGANFLLTAGQGVEDLMRFSDVESPSQALAVVAESRHLCPTAPDTCPCYPFDQTDPFCIPEGPTAPHILLSGPHRTKARYEKVGGVTLVTVPDFEHARQALLIGVPSLMCHVWDFTVK